MNENTYSLREVPLSLSSERRRVVEMLADNGLRPEHFDVYIGVFDSDDCLLGGGGLDGNTIKCVALGEQLRGEAISNALITRLRSEARAAGHRDIFLFTKPENEPLFNSLAFKTVARSDKALMLESNPRGIAAYTDYLRSLARPGRNGAIVMNCNPMTRGHLALIEKAAAEVDNLYIIPVKEDRSRFPYVLRRDMLSAVCADIPNVTVCRGSDYAVSAATFPSYFLKQADDATDTSIELDLDIFCRHIAPALNVSVRFAGSEPSDALTARYNQLMAGILPGRGVEFREIKRVEAGGEPISASRVRRLLDERRIADAISLMPRKAACLLLGNIAGEALRKELDLTPKPGLIDKADSGAHTDMDYDMMCRSIEVLSDGFGRLLMAESEPLPIAEARQLEEEMLEATGGVNTHRGALFAMSLTLIAALRLVDAETAITSGNLCREISRLAAMMPRPDGTHGSEATRRYGAKGALDVAREGYPFIAGALRTLRSHTADPMAGQKTLLQIIGLIDDTNVLHRAGDEGAEWLRREAKRISADCSVENLIKLNSECIGRNISPGGAADMLALTYLFDSLTLTAPCEN